MSVNLLVLNIENDRHVKEVADLMTQESVDVACLQEVTPKAFRRIKDRTGMGGAYVPMTKKHHMRFYDRHGSEGIAVLTNQPYRSVSTDVYSDESPMENRHARKRLLASYCIHAREGEFIIGHTQGYWTRCAQETPEQLEAAMRLNRFAHRHDRIILCGDMNTPRGGNAYAIISRGFKDYLPVAVTTTLDPKHAANRAESQVRLAVDTILAKGYHIQDVRLVEGVSDHKAILARLER